LGDLHQATPGIKNSLTTSAHARADGRHLNFYIDRLVAVQRELEVMMPETLNGGISKQRPPKVRLFHEFTEAEIRVVGQLVGHTIAEVECELIRETLVHHRGNRSHAAKVLDVSIRALRNKIRAYRAFGIAVPEPSQSDRMKVNH
jgi:DNA-binding NtrC family response regulator